MERKEKGRLGYGRKKIGEQRKEKRKGEKGREESAEKNRENE